MTVLISSIYHKFLKALVYKEGHQARSKALDISKKNHFLLQVMYCCQMICKFRVLLTVADAHMNHWAGSLTDCK